MDFGLTEEQYKSTKDLFLQYPEITLVKIFGSRAMGNFRPNSDVDLVCWGVTDELLISEILAQLDELPMPYLFDLQSYENIQHPQLKQHINKHGKIFYTIKF